MAEANKKEMACQQVGSTQAEVADYAKTGPYDPYVLFLTPKPQWNSRLSHLPLVLFVPFFYTAAVQMNQDWDIKLRGDVCHKCNTPFADKQPYFSALTYDIEGYKRADYCINCRPGKPDTAPLVSCWQGIYRMPPPPAEEPLKKETAESLLRGLMEKNDPAKINVIYILAVMLERKRIIVERDVQRSENGVTIRVYEHRETGESFMIREPHLQLDQLEHVQAEVIAMLGGGQDGETVQPADDTPQGEPGQAPAEPAPQ